MIEVTVKVDLSRLKRFAKTASAGMRGGGGDGGPIGAAFQQWGARFRGFIQLWFDRFSKGGGDWQPLRPSTKARRRGARKGVKGARSFSLLRDTGTLFMALTPTFSVKPGQLQESIPFGVRVGYGGPARHPKGAATVADIARFHQKGGPHLPARTIIVGPDAHLVALMAGDMQRAIGKLADDSGVGPGGA